MITHEIGRVAGPTWIVCGFIGYLFYRRHKKLPIFGSRPQDWDAQQVLILKDAGELEGMDELVEKLRVRGRGVAAPGRAP
jgi:hypothetical protein